MYLHIFFWAKIFLYNSAMYKIHNKKRGHLKLGYLNPKKAAAYPRRDHYTLILLRDFSLKFKTQNLQTDKRVNAIKLFCFATMVFHSVCWILFYFMCKIKILVNYCIWGIDWIVLTTIVPHRTFLFWEVHSLDFQLPTFQTNYSTVNQSYKTLHFNYSLYWKDNR